MVLHVLPVLLAEFLPQAQAHADAVMVHMKTQQL